MIKELDSMPTEGQFVAVWEYNGLPWSNCFAYDDEGNLMIFDSVDDRYRKSYGEHTEVLEEAKFYVSAD